MKTRMNNVLHAVLAMALVSMSAWAATEDHLLNPSFTMGEPNTTPVGWEKYIGSDDFECIRDTSAYHSAPASLKSAGYTDKSGGGAHFQLRKVPAGAEVTISAWVKFDRASGRGQFAVEVVNFNPRWNQLQWMDVALSASSSPWTYVNKTLTIHPEATAVYLTTFLKSNTRIWVDDVEIEVAGSPATAVDCAASTPLRVRAAGRGADEPLSLLRIDGRVVGRSLRGSALWQLAPCVTVAAGRTPHTIPRFSAR